MVCTTSLTSLLARSGVSFDYDLASVCEEFSAHQRCDEKTAEGYYMLWRCYSARRDGDHMKLELEGDDLGSPIMSLASSVSIRQVGLSCTTLRRHKLEMEGLGADNLILGRGAFGTVVLGKWCGVKVAVKVMESEATARRKKSLESEVLACRLDHENVVKVFRVYGVEQRHAIIIMEYVGSKNLHHLLVERREKYLGRDWLLDVAFQVTKAVAHCHKKGVLHLDVKPANVLVSRRGVCKLGDFGCSIVTSKKRVSSGNKAFLVGTPGYQAPELLLGKVPTGACDVYSLGLLFWQLDSREVPYARQHPQAVMWSVVAVDARPTAPPLERAAVGLQGFSLLYTQCWKPLAEHRPGAELVLKWLEALNDNKATKSTVSVERRSRLLRIYAGSMLSGVEYKTMRVLPLTTAFHLIVKLLDTFNLRHVDPNLFSVQLELGTENNLLTLAPEDTLFRLLTSLPWACKPLKARLKPRPGGKLEVHCSCPLQACGATRVQVAVDSKVEQVLEVVLKTKMEERIGGEKLVEVSPNGKRRVLEPEESPYQVAGSSLPGWRLEVERNIEEETHLWWRKCSNFDVALN